MQIIIINNNNNNNNNNQLQYEKQEMISLTNEEKKIYRG